jgi:hypothetical protein
MSKKSPKQFFVQSLFKKRKINLSIDFPKILPNLRYKYFTERDTDLNFYTFVPKFKDILLLKDWLLTRCIRWVITYPQKIRSLALQIKKLKFLYSRNNTEELFRMLRYSTLEVMTLEVARSGFEPSFLAEG